MRLPHWLLPRSLVGRVFALYTVTLLVFVVGGVGHFYRYQFDVELEEAQLRAEALSAVLQPAVADSAVIGDYDTIRRTLERAVYDSSFAAASFIDVKGGVVRAPRNDAPVVQPPGWLLKAVAERLYDNNHAINVGGRDYGVLRLSFAPERIAGRLWQQTRIAGLLAVLSLSAGLLLIRVLLMRWLGNLSRIQAFEDAMHSGQAPPALLASDETPLEFRKTFEVLGRAAASLQAQRVQASVTLSAIADGVFTLDPDGRVVFANPAACAMVAQPAAALLGRLAAEVLPQVMAGREGLAPWAGHRVALADHGGRAVVLDTTLSTILAPDGSTAGFVLACRDVSEPHALEQRLRTELQSRQAALISLRKVLEGFTQEAGARPNTNNTPPDRDDLAAISAMVSDIVTRLQVRGDQLDAIFALSPDGFMSMTAQGRVNYVSPAFETLTGIDPGQVLGRSAQHVEQLLRRQCDHALPWSGLAALGDAALRGNGTPQRDRIELVRPVRRVLELGLRSGASQAIAKVLSLRDVTHETEVDQMKSEFLSTAAHELRTPMASIFGFAELMMVRKLTPERQAEVMATIHRQTQLMIHIVNELLDLARIESRRGKDFSLETVDLAVLVAELIHDFSPPGQRGAPHLQPTAQPVHVRVDRQKMQQAIGNVLSNAYKYSPQGGDVTLRIVSPADRALQEVGVQVQDAGIGMAREHLARVSERFFRADTSGNIPGTGLGMSIVKEIIGLLGGRMELASTLGHGTCVTLWLPLAAAPGPHLQTQAESAETAAA
jgi:signal transduction histidine kinase